MSLKVIFLCAFITLTVATGALACLTVIHRGQAEPWAGVTIAGVASATAWLTFVLMRNRQATTRQFARLERIIAAARREAAIRDGFQFQIAKCERCVLHRPDRQVMPNR